MKNGIVFKIEGDRAVVLLSDGTFISAKAQSTWKTGDVVPVSQKKKSSRFILRACAACLAIFLLGGFGWKQLYANPVAVISLDVNPSIELEVNRFDRIVDTSAFNKEGQQILKDADVKNKGYQDGLESIFNVEETSGYLKEDANVVFTVFSSDDQVEAQMLAQLEKIADTAVPDYDEQINTECHAVDSDTVKGAHNHGVTAGKYLYIQQLEELEPDTDLSQYTHHSIEEIKKDIHVCKQERKRTRGQGKGNGNGNGGCQGQGSKEGGQGQGHGHGHGHE